MSSSFDYVSEYFILIQYRQFGNMLLLAATYQSWLRELVPLAEFNALLDRTINFLRTLAPISPSLTWDTRILEKVRLLINNSPTGAYYSSSRGSSFTSAG